MNQLLNSSERYSHTSAEDGGEENQCVVEISRLNKSFDDHAVLNDISIVVSKGENLAVLGKSGVGKSVLIKCIAGLIETDAGIIKLFGSDINTVDRKELARLRKKIGFLFQGAALFDSMSVRENLEFPLRTLTQKPSPQETEDLVMNALADVGLSEAIDKMPSELSGGMRKRLGLARSLIQQPEIMLYDEPTTGLDPVTSREISRLILEVQKTKKTSSIIITHDIECTKITSNRIVVIDGGLCVAEGTYEELTGSDNELVRSFFEWQA
jgi:phospholipid/cholesterol/gamma-HCH transport system ATP-binding protein